MIVRLILLFVVFTINSYSQDFIQMKDGKRIDVADGSIYNEPSRKKLRYELKDLKKSQYVKYKDLDYASFGGFLFKSFVVNNKSKGYFVIVETSQKYLVIGKQTKIKNRGGFESTYSKYEIAVLTNESHTFESLSFTDENTEKKRVLRSKVIPMIKSHFSDCNKLIERTTLFESPASDTNITIILAFMNDPKFINCN